MDFPHSLSWSPSSNLHLGQGFSSYSHVWWHRRAIPSNIHICVGYIINYISSNSLDHYKNTIKLSHLFLSHCKWLQSPSSGCWKHIDVAIRTPNGEFRIISVVLCGLSLGLSDFHLLIQSLFLLLKSCQLLTSSISLAFSHLSPSSMFISIFPPWSHHFSPPQSLNPGCAGLARSGARAGELEQRRGAG